MKIVFQFLLVLVFLAKAHAQIEIPVNLYTGTPSINIPLGTVSGHGLADNIYLTYRTSRAAVAARSGSCGIGWSLDAGGSIVREVRGLPDDYKGTGSDLRRGWLYDQNNVNTGGFSNSSDNSTSTCVDEQTDYNYINALAYNKDTEPDIFYYSIPGHSGSFVFDNTAAHLIRLIPYADIKIDPAFVTNTKTIKSFTITTNDGNRYIFNTSSSETTSTMPAIPDLPIEFEKTKFELYKKSASRPAISCMYKWNLDSIKAPDNAYLYYKYTTVIEKDFRYLPNVNANVASYSYAIDIRQVDKKLSAIYSSSGKEVKFIYSNKSNSNNSDAYGLLTEVLHYDNRKIDGPFYKKFSIAYDYYFPCPNGCDDSVDGQGDVEASFNRAFIKSIAEESACSKIPPYEFAYITPEKFPLPVENAIDAWGYYNRHNAQVSSRVYIYPQLAPHEQYRIFPISNYGGEKYETTVNIHSLLPHEDSAKIGTLKTIKFPSGGKVTLEFGLHEFFDPVAQEMYKAGGLRINRITYSDGIDNLKDIVENYSYRTSGNVSSGKLLNHPKFIIPTDEYKKSDNPIAYSSHQQLIQQGYNPWVYLAHKSRLDLNTDASTVVYSVGKVSKVGQGYSITEFSTPATWGETVAGEWQASTIKIARSSGCNTVDFIKSGSANIYPYPPNPIYSYAQGLTMSVKHFSEQGVLLKETVYAYRDLYKTGSSAFKVWGLNYEKIPYWTDGFLFSKYFLLTDASKVISSETTKEFDANNQAKFATTVRSYFYESTAHRLLSRMQVTTSDGSTHTTRYKYPLDFGTISSTAGESALMIKKLQDTRNGAPLESYTTVKQGASAETTISASTSILSAFAGTYPLVKHELSLKPVEVPNFVPSTIQSNNVKVDARYDTMNTFLSYLPYSTPSSSIGNDRLPKGLITGFNQTTTIAALSNALPNQVAFSDFETVTDRSFDISGTMATGVPRSGTKSIRPTVGLSKTLKKATDKYYLSFWLLRKHATVINLYVKNVAKTQTYHSQTISFSAGGSAFEYFEYLFPLNAAPTDFIVEIQCSVPNPPANANLMPLIDDVAVYPANAELKTNTYSQPFGITSETNRNQTSYVVYDDFGRVSAKKDKDGNMVEKITYYYPEMSVPSFKASFNYSMPANLLQPVIFTAQPQSCAKDLTYQWDFGQGYVNGSQIMTNTFGTLGQRTVKLRITHPLEGPSEYSTVVDVKIPPEQTAHFTTSTVPETGGMIAFTARDNSSLGSNVVYEWNFGEGYTAGAREISKTIFQSQVVYLRVSSNNSLIAPQVYSKFIKIINPDPR